MLVYLHDGTVNGILTVMAEALRAEPGPEEIAPAATWQPGLFSDARRVGTDEAAAEALLQACEQRLSRDAARTVLHAISAERPGCEHALYQFVKLGFARGGDVAGYHAHPAVRLVLDLERKVTHEIHRLHGLLRFRQLRDGSLYAPCEPDGNVILGVAWHFQERLRAERWIIHDVRRGLAVFWDGQRLDAGELAAEPGGAAGLESDAERVCQQLWQVYHSAIAIPERRNPELQRRCMPRRYWKYLVERPHQ